MTAPSFVSAGTYLAGSGASAAVAVPSGTAATRLAVVSMFLDGNVQTVTPPSGFLEAENSPSQITGIGGAHGFHTFWKRLTGADAGTWSFTWPSSTYREAIATLYQDVIGSGTPFDSPTNAAQDTGASTVSPAVAVTSLGPDRLLIWGGTNWSGGTWTAPSGHTKRAQGGAGVFSLSDRPWPTASSTGPVTGSCTGSDKRTAWLGALIGTTGAGGSDVPPTSARRMRPLLVR
ncbi:hypothetical protein [Spongiactinospora sp. TRM90649]|uniref:hypothetical protein n=1 Tax=Spongiactinospora sp. TRM90649 TaxID=3031114 RepID=UPI0023F8BADC|nr:hypothetical protein [Spongiactinospora sp. TRM90649]MDF5758607.1 hypothetical protein [Spongiactinospora sp. TRM90649]